jgi:glycosyltransferase involved in cell wall biosynthesis
MNSRHESFGLSALDALRAGCSVLLSKDCGVLEALNPQGSDVVEDCEDAEEVAEKMAYLLRHPNARRLYESIDFDAMSWDTQVGRLRQMCADAVARKGGTQ